MSDNIIGYAAGAGIEQRAFGTSYFLFLKYDVYTIDRNIDRYLDEINVIKDLFCDAEDNSDRLRDEINKSNCGSRYHPRTVNRIFTLSQKNFNDRRASDEDRMLIAIAYWQICKLRKVPSVLKFLIKGAKGGRSVDHSFLEDGGMYTCVDTSAIIAVVCEKLGIEGEIKNDGIGSVMGFHHFFETKTGRIIDVPFGLLESGFFFDSSDHPKTYKIVISFFRSSARRFTRRLGFKI